MRRPNQAAELPPSLLSPDHFHPTPVAPTAHPTPPFVFSSYTTLRYGWRRPKSRSVSNPDLLFDLLFHFWLSIAACFYFYVCNSLGVVVFVVVVISFSAGSLFSCNSLGSVVTRLPTPHPPPLFVLYNRTTSDTAGVQHTPCATQVSSPLHLTRSPAAASHPIYHGLVTKDAVSKWRALRRRGDPGIDIPDSLPRNTRVGSLPRKIDTVTYVRPEP